MKLHLAAVVITLAASGTALSGTELEQLRKLCAEQEMQIRQLELKIARLTNTPPLERSEEPVNRAGSSARDFQPVAGDHKIYTVKSGDNVVHIARRHGVTVSALNRLNSLEKTSIIHPGQKLKIPSESVATGKSASPAPVARTHKIASGETFYSIARKYGVSVDDLTRANPDVNHRALRVGSEIDIPADEGSPITEKSPAPKPEPEPSLLPAPSLPVSNPPEQPDTPEQPIKINTEITYGEFAKNYNTTPERLDELNGLELDPSTVLARGSELYIPTGR